MLEGSRLCDPCFARDYKKKKIRLSEVDLTETAQWCTGTGDEAQLVECLHKTLGSISGIPLSQAWGSTAIKPQHSGSQTDQVFKVILSYLMSLRLAQ